LDLIGHLGLSISWSSANSDIEFEERKNKKRANIIFYINLYQREALHKYKDKFTLFRMVGEKWTAHVAPSDDWKGRGTKRHQKEGHPVHIY